MTQQQEQDAKLKVGGERYVFVKDCILSQQKIILSKGYSLAECQDGWYQVIQISGANYHMRLGPARIEKFIDDNVITLQP